MQVEVSRREVEFSEKWIQKNLDLFSKSLTRFFRECEEDGLTFIGRFSEYGTITYVAERDA